MNKKSSDVGVLLVNLGTPDAPTPSAIRRYLREFLSDIRVIDYPRWLWLPLLHGVILPIRSRKVASAYQSIWTEQGSPLRVITEQQRDALADAFGQQAEADMPVEYAMSYGQPNIRDVLPRLVQQGVRKLVVLPLYPQYSCSTVASVFDAVANACKPLRHLPEIRMVHNYHDHPLYIQALADSVRAHWQQHGQSQLLLMSFHGIPQRYANEGDPYPEHCRQTAEALAAALELTPEQYQMTFQSRVGKEQWLQPYTDKFLESAPDQGTRNIDVICPAFSADCLETLEEIAEENRDVFLEAGGESYRYIPALNASEGHIRLLAQLVDEQSAGW